MKLVIGNKNYSTWSLRPWLLLTAYGIEFEEIRVSLLPDGIDKRLGSYSSSNKVPVLIEKELTIWDSLAICEYISENYLDGKGWPKDIKMRAEARAVCSEMHSGFMGIRNELPMNCRATRKIEFTIEAKKDIKRIDEIWSNYSPELNNQGSWLFGEFSIVDCFFAPVALRFSTYGVSLSKSSEKYANHLRNHPSVLSWVMSGKTETEILTDNEAGS